MNNVIFKERLKLVDKMISIAKNETDLERKIQLLEKINLYMASNHCGIFRYEPMEDLLQGIGTNFIVDKKENFTKNTFLHIMTTAYVIGGHTRVVENFINNRKDYNEVHNVLLISQNNEKKPDFIQKMELEGNLFDLSSLNIIEKINKISFLATKYEYIILHHHMFDVVPIIALSQFKDTKKIFAYNHADHLYWVGSSIITGSFEMGTDGMNFSKRRRGISNTILLPVPIKQKNKIDGSDLRKKLNISPEKKIVLTIGGIERFVADGYSYKDMLNQVLKDDKIVFIIIGNHIKEFWGKLWNHKNIRFEGVVPREKLNKYYAIADVYVDSFSRGGRDVVLDAISYGIPTIKVKDIFFEFDSLKSFTVNKEEVPNKLIQLLSKKDKKNEIEKISMHFKPNWNKIFDNFLNKKYIRKDIKNKEKIETLEQYDLDLYNFQMVKKFQL